MSLICIEMSQTHYKIVGTVSQTMPHSSLSSNTSRDFIGLNYARKKKAREFRRVELDTRAKLDVATAHLHEDMYNTNIQGKFNEFGKTLEEIEDRKARDAHIRAKVK